jgi:hypothetical protein
LSSGVSSSPVVVAVEAADARRELEDAAVEATEEAEARGPEERWRQRSRQARSGEIRGREGHITAAMPCGNRLAG